MNAARVPQPPERTWRCLENDCTWDGWPEVADAADHMLDPRERHELAVHVGPALRALRPNRRCPRCRQTAGAHTGPCQASLRTRPGGPAKAYLTYEQCLERYPRLARCLQYILIGSPGEVGCCIRDYRDGFAFSGEAVSHSGLTPRDRIQDAVANRHTIRMLDGGALLRVR